MDADDDDIGTRVRTLAEVMRRRRKPPRDRGLKPYSLKWMVCVIQEGGLIAAYETEQEAEKAIHKLVEAAEGK